MNCRSGRSLFPYRSRIPVRAPVRVRLSFALIATHILQDLAAPLSVIRFPRPHHAHLVLERVAATWGSCSVRVCEGQLWGEDGLQ
jgi:hypothetical protein